MKALVLAVAFAALSSSALATASRDAAPSKNGTADTTTAVMADASRLGSASLTALNASPWGSAHRDRTDTGTGFEALTEQVDGGTLLILLGVLALTLGRPLTRMLRRQEQQRRAAALAATLPRR